MAKKFRRKKKGYQYKTKIRRNKYSQREQLAYLKLVFALLLLMGFAGLVYLKGIDFIAFYGSFWRQNGNSPTPEPTTTNNNNLLPPLLDPLPSAIKEGYELTISGTSADGMHIKIFINGDETVKILIDSDRTFKKIIKEGLQEGENAISVISVNAKGDESRPSEEQIILLDTKPPELTVNYPEDQLEITSTNNTIEIKGETESPKITVTVNGYRSIVDLEGQFSYLLGLIKGENQIKIKAEDQVGHTTKTNLKVYYNIDTPEDEVETDESAEEEV